MLEFILVWAIICLGIIDLTALIILSIHHFYTVRSRLRMTEIRNHWLMSLQHLIKSGDLSGLTIGHQKEFLVIAEALHTSPAIQSISEKQNLNAVLEQLGYIDFYLARLNNRWWWIRAEAAMALAETHSDKVIEPLINALEDGALSVRLKAATALAILKQRDAIVRLAKILPTLGFVSVEWLKDLFYLILRDNTEYLKDLFSAIDEPLVKKSLVEVVGELEGSDYSLLVALLENENEDLETKISAIKSLGRLRAGAETIRKILSSEDWQLRAVAAKALGELNDDTAIILLKERLSDSNWWVRVNSAHALLKMGEVGVTELKNNLTAVDFFARDIARQALAEADLIKVGDINA